MMLEEGGLEVTEASNTEAALKRLAKEPVDVVIADLVMPGFDGLSLIRIVAGQPEPRPAIIAMTGQAHLADRTNPGAAQSLGADALLLKPFSAAEARKVIAAVLGDGKREEGRGKRTNP